MLASKRIVVTGGAGFIGSHIVDVLVESGADVSVLDNLSSGRAENIARAVAIHAVDLRDRKAVMRTIRELQPEAICHHAAQPSVPRSLKEPLADFDANVASSVNLLEAARKYDCSQFVFASSGGAIAGDIGDGAPKTEDDRPHLANPYAAAKLATEVYLEAYRNAYGLQTWAMRYANVYGPRQDPFGEAGVVALFCAAAIEGRPLLVNGRNRKGDEGCARDFVYVSDVAEVSRMAFADELPPGTYNVGTGSAVTTQQLAQAVETAAAQRSEISGRVKIQPNKPRPGDVHVSALNADRLRAAGWSPKVTLEEGIIATLDDAIKSLGIQ